MITKSRKKSQNFFNCKKCLYSTSNNYDWDKHINTTKHKKITNGIAKKYECICGKSYKFSSGLSRHKKKCISSRPNDVTGETETNMFNICDTIKELMEDNRKNQKLIGKMLEQNTEMLKQNSVLIPKVGNNNNNKISINVFLNDKCKDAMNLEDFIDTVKVTIEDLLYTKDNGYVKGISNIFVKHLTDMKPTERPIHCSDQKRLQFYVKDDNKWEKDNMNKKIDNTIKKVEMKQILHLKEWERKNPNYLIDDDLMEEWHYMILEIMGGKSDDGGQEKDKSKINIKKEISNTILMREAMKKYC